MRRIAVLTSGGDAPGMNATVRAVVRTAVYNNVEVYGVQRGFKGLIEGDFIKLNVSFVGDIIHRGGTVLRSARCLEFQNQESCRKCAVDLLNVFQIDGLIVIGGDGSFRGMTSLTEYGFSTIGIPGTIDNDLAYTDFTIGFDTAVNTVVEAMSKLRDTTSSHERITIVEVMGRRCGDIALYAGLSGGAEAILIPEVQYDLSQIAEQLIKSNNRGKKQSIIVVAEGVGNTEFISKEINRLTGFDTMTTILGHVQRGGNPSSRDRLLGSMMGNRAVDLLLNNITNRVVGVKDNQIMDMDINDALCSKKRFNREMYNLSKVLSI